MQSLGFFERLDVREVGAIRLEVVLRAYLGPVVLKVYERTQDKEAVDDKSDHRPEEGALTLDKLDQREQDSGVVELKHGSNDATPED